VIPNRRLALAAGGGSGWDDPDPIAQPLREVVHRSHARSAVIIDAYGQIPAMYTEGMAGRGIDLSFLSSTREETERLMSGHTVWLTSARVVARLCGTHAVLFVVKPDRPKDFVERAIDESAGRVAEALLADNPDAAPMEIENLTDLICKRRLTRGR